MTRILRAGAAGLLLSLWLAATAAAGPTVSVRVEGQNATLLPRTTVTLPDANGSFCGTNTAGNALDLATQGNWDREEFTETVLGETHTFANNDFWALWVRRGDVYKVSNGLCTEKLAAGEELLVATQFADPTTFEFQLAPLLLTGVPSTVQTGQAFTVTVTRSECETSDCLPGEGRAVPAPGVRVAVGSFRVTTDADGRATLSVDSPGAATVTATSETGIRAAALPVTATAPPAPGASPSPSPSPSASPSASPAPIDSFPSGTEDTADPVVVITGLRRTYRKRRGPRRLSATVVDTQGLEDVKLALTQRSPDDCAAYGATRERFRRISCERRLLFSVGESGEVDYLLPRRLRRGRYRLDVIGIDDAGNRTEHRRWFRVR